jgi:hypothetical protein
MAVAVPASAHCASVVNVVVWLLKHIHEVGEAGVNVIRLPGVAIKGAAESGVAPSLTSSNEGDAVLVLAMHSITLRLSCAVSAQTRSNVFTAVQRLTLRVTTFTVTLIKAIVVTAPLLKAPLATATSTEDDEDVWAKTVPLAIMDLDALLTTAVIRLPLM